MIWVLTAAYLVFIFILVKIASYLPRNYNNWVLTARLWNKPYGAGVALTKLLIWCGILTLLLFLSTWLYIVLAIKYTLNI